ncbi:MAG: hypothetical protein ACTSP3_13820 [Candidatus Heimdallarchaeaceae archaeon]
MGNIAIDTIWIIVTPTVIEEYSPILTGFILVPIIIIIYIVKKRFRRFKIF